MKRTLLLLLFLTIILSAQNISVKVNGLENWRASIYSINLQKSNFITTISSDSKGQFNIPSNKLYDGFYRLVFDKNHWINFIYDGKDIKIVTNKDDIFKSLKVILSDANKIYYKYLALNSRYKTEKEKLQKAIAKYPTNNQHLIIIKKDFAFIQKKYLSFFKKFSFLKNNSLISHYIISVQEPQIKSGLNVKTKRQYLEEHFWDNVDFKDAELLNSDLFINKTIEYLKLLGEFHPTKSILEKKYKNAVDIILNKAKVNGRVYKHFTEYLIKGFKKLQFNNVIDYIVDNFIIRDDLCLDSNTEKFIQIRINQSKYFKKNVKVPNIKLHNTNGKIINLYSTNADKILILFYSSNCPHCQKLLPKLLKLYSDKAIERFVVYAISLDRNFYKWQNFISNNKYNWINVSDLMGWNSKVANTFYVYATPTMFLVDKNFRIIDRPKNFELLKTDLLKN